MINTSWLCRSSRLFAYPYSAQVRLTATEIMRSQSSNEDSRGRFHDATSLIAGQAANDPGTRAAMIKALSP